MTRPSDPDRFSRQLRFAPIAEDGQRRLAAARAGVAGCGALGTVIAERLVRAGVGLVRVADRDVVETSNLPRQALFTEADVAARLPKAEAAARHLRAIDGAAVVESVVVDLGPRTARRFVEGLDVVVDGLDNFETRFVLNDACLEAGVPWVYGGVVGSAGMVMVVRPGGGPCLRCWMPDVPPAGALPTCDTAGVVGTAPMVIGALEATEALKLLVGSDAGLEGLLHVDVWHAGWQQLPVARDPRCRSCGTGERPHRHPQSVAHTTALCGRGAVQVAPPEDAGFDRAALAERLARVVTVEDNGYLLAFEGDGHAFTVFADGRTVVGGTTDETEARALYAKWIGA